MKKIISIVTYFILSIACVALIFYCVDNLYSKSYLYEGYWSKPTLIIVIVMSILIGLTALAIAILKIFDRESKNFTD